MKIRIQLHSENDGEPPDSLGWSDPIDITDYAGERPPLLVAQRLRMILTDTVKQMEKIAGRTRIRVERPK